MITHIIPVAYDHGAPERGAGHGPEALRAAGLGRRLRAEGIEFAWSPSLRPQDAVDPVVELAQLARRLSQRVGAALARGRFPLVLGGDHAIAIGTWAGVAQARRAAGPIGLLWIDAHMDAHTPGTSETGMLHGMPLACLLGAGDPTLTTVGTARPKLLPEHVCLVGVRSFESGEASFLAEIGVKVFGMDEVRRRGLDAVLNDALAIVRRAPGGYGITFDTDAIDPAEAPGVTVPEAGGLSFDALAAALRRLVRAAPPVALEVVEYNPLNDREGRTAHQLIELTAGVLRPAHDKETAMSSHIIASETRHGARNYAPLPVVLTRGRGALVWDESGRRYIDMMSAYSAVSLGHSHPRLVQVLTEQAARLAVVSRAYHTDRLAPFLERLCALTGMDRVLPVNTGLEAVETALKAARKWGHTVKGIPDGQAEIICCDGNFHGRSIAIVGMSSEPQYRAGFGPFPEGFRRIPYGDVEALERAITARTAAFLVEPIQGEGGIIVPPAGYLARCAEICRRHNVLFIADEVQTGLARTGRMFAWEYDGVRPDGICLGKALGGGLLPVSAFAAREDVMAVFTPGDHGSTFGGNPLAASVGAAVLDILVEEDLAGRAARLGRRLMDGLQSLNSSLVREVRGRGLLVGVEIDTRLGEARELAERLLAAGILTKETHDTVLRFAPPLVISEQELDEALGIIGQVFADCAAEVKAAA